ncbi:MAG: Fe(3+) ABC transporter substrate-binding protein [Flavobacteriales bacterium]
MLRLVLPACLCILLTGCADHQHPVDQQPAPTQEVNVYSHRHYDVDKQLFADFEKSTGIVVHVIDADDDELLARLASEGANSTADVILTSDAGRLGLCKQGGFLQPITSAVLQANVPKHLRDVDNNWYGLTMRARVIAYDKNKVKPAEVASYDALTGPRFKGKLLVRSSENAYNQSLVAAMIARLGHDKTLAWCKGIVANMARDPKGSDTDQMLAIGEGLGEVAMVNSYYIGKLLTSTDSAKQKAKGLLAVSYPLLGGGFNTHVNVSGGGVAAHAKNKDNAIKLLEFLSSDAAQRVFAEGNMEFPVKPGVAMAPALQAFGTLVQDDLDLSKLGELNVEAVKMMGEAGWK